MNDNVYFYFYKVEYFDPYECVTRSEKGITIGDSFSEAMKAIESRYGVDLTSIVRLEPLSGSSVVTFSELEEDGLLEKE